MGAKAEMTFEDWLHDAGLVGMSRREIDLMEEAWNAADKAAREECAKICADMPGQMTASKQPVIDAARILQMRYCEETILASISGESHQPE